MNIAIVLSGGTGSRVGGDTPKQYVRVQGQMMITRVLGVLNLAKEIDNIIIVADEKWRDAINTDLGAKAAMPVEFADAGSSRQGSILNGLRVSADVLRGGAFEPDDTVLICDSARPFISQELISRIYAALVGHDGVMPYLAMRDTVYYSDNGSRIDRLLPRDNIIAGQAPELFLADKYLKANEALLDSELSEIRGSCEAAFRAGMDIALVHGDDANIKITTSADMDAYMDMVNSNALD